MNVLIEYQPKKRESSSYELFMSKHYTGPIKVNPVAMPFHIALLMCYIIRIHHKPLIPV